MVKEEINLNGLSDTDIVQSRNLHGNNSIKAQDDHVFGHLLKEIVVEPMFILLMVAGVIYFFVGDYLNGIIKLPANFADKNPSYLLVNYS